MTDQALKDAVRLGVMRGLALGRPMSDASTPDGYNATFLIDTIVEHVEVYIGAPDDGWQLARDARKEETQQ